MTNSFALVEYVPKPACYVCILMYEIYSYIYIKSLDYMPIGLNVPEAPELGTPSKPYQPNRPVFQGINNTLF